MRHILAPANLDVLAQLAWSRVLLAFDFDGTLAPIVEDRDRAAMRPRTRVLLGEVCRRYPCAVISGRSRDDVASRLSGIPLAHLVGNHGLEPGEHMAAFERQVRLALPSLLGAVDGLQGVDLEDKRYSLAIHYRRSRSKRAARRAIYEAVGALDPPMRAIAGKLVVNAVPARAPHKGDALVRLRRDIGADTALYVGDDITDEDVFVLDQPGRLLCVRVGRSVSSAAPYYLRDQREVDAMLRRLVGFRSNGSAR